MTTTLNTDSPSGAIDNDDVKKFLLTLCSNCLSLDPRGIIHRVTVTMDIKYCSDVNQNVLLYSGLQILSAPATATENNDARMLVSVSTLTLLLALFLAFSRSYGYVRFCYFTNWSQYRVNAVFTPQDIDPALCTHIIYAFAALENNTINPTEYNDFTLYGEIMSLKKSNPALKVLLAIGGWEADNSQFTRLVSSAANMATFSESAIGYLREHKFDGLDIDWEYPAGRGGPPTDRPRFTTLLQALDTAFTQEARASNLPKLLLTIAVVAGINQANNYYQIENMSRHVDFINIMAYDLHGSWETSTGIHSALYPDVDDAITGWLNAKAPREKVVLGVAAFGRTFRLASSDPNPVNFGLGQRSAGPGMAGPNTRANGSLSYSEICELLLTGNWTSTYSATHDSPMAYGQVGNDINWVGYDNILSVREKAKYIRDRGLAGSMIWSLDFDDFRNICGDNRYPLAGALLEQLPSDGEVGAPTTTQCETTTTAQLTTTDAVSTTTTSETTTTPEATTTAIRQSTTTPSDVPTTPSDDSTPSDPGWVTTTPTPSTTPTTTPIPTEGTSAPTTKAPRRPTLSPPRIPFSRPVGPDVCSLRLSNANSDTLVQGNPRLFVAWRRGVISIVCECPATFVYNPCIKLCDYRTNRATCSRWF
ncbi:chitinase-3-like protein 1 [Haliotis asinina]|uniref:chitinase-3-like protein 1 n=1 Tax=Haliotis asinina TaxID=109174 RepID=UPI003531AE88